HGTRLRVILPPRTVAVPGRCGGGTAGAAGPGRGHDACTIPGMLATTSSSGRAHGIALLALVVLALGIGVAWRQSRPVKVPETSRRVAPPPPPGGPGGGGIARAPRARPP